MKIFLILWITVMAQVVNVDKLLNPNYLRKGFYQTTHPVVLLWGGSDAGKSYAIADKLLLLALYRQDIPKIKIVCLRKTLPSLKRSVLDILQTRVAEFHLPFDLNKQDMIAQCRNLQFVFCSLNNKEDYQKLKSMTNVDIFWINELLELRRSDFEECMRRKRGGMLDFSQMICDFNPEDEFHWIKEMLFEDNIHDPFTINCTIEDNHPDYLKSEKGKASLALLDSYKKYDKNLYHIFRKGEWGSLKGRIFKWIKEELPYSNLDWYDEIFYGGDFGFTVDPAALVRIYRKAMTFWVEQVIYETGLTNPALAERMKDEGIARHAEQIWDSAEPKSIQELRNLGFNVKPSRKGPDSVRAGTDFVKSLDVRIIDGSINIEREHKQYVYKTDKDGKSLNVPIEKNDHAIRAIVYALYTKYGIKRGKVARPATVNITSWA